ncbi:MAG: MHS family MFS transporter [Verrucomicrobiae bacterium]|nr:MHS family MFS transporter [Verrucomicrobiae bacterium]MCB1088597.1 MHS family MFS transporter [Verrucomicrobiae bacterium]MCB1090779.1 MHS family MFS transporter [Verrucomicrobiae bacterium]
MSVETETSHSVRRVVVASFIGTTIEWYDFFLYGTAAALVFPEIFFPNSDPQIGTIQAFATYAVGFFARPVGGVVFSHYGDRLGRKSVLVLTLMLMGVATFLIGLLPTYASAGIWAPALLVALRFVQGFGVGGEWGGAVLMAVEHGHEGKRGLHASWVQAGVPIGLLLANGVFATVDHLMPDEAFRAWGWRIPFLLGIFLLGIGLFIRMKIMESPLFEKMTREKRQAKVPVLEVIRKHPKNVLLAMGMRFSENASFYIITVIALSYAFDWLKVPRETVYTGVLLGSAVQFFAIPFFGALSDRLGRRPVYLTGAAIMLGYPFLFFAMLDSRVAWVMWLAITLGLVVHAMMYAPQAAFFSELFGTNVRYSGASLGYQLASPFSGGLAPVIAASLLARFEGQSWPVSAYLVAMGIITLTSVWLAAETHRHSLED